MKPELIAALAAIANLDAARLHAWAAHHTGLQQCGAGLHFDPEARSPYETELRVWVDEQLSHLKG